MNPFMKKSIFLIALGAIPVLASAQNAIDAFSVARSDMKGTARFMSMGGAFGALGGDLSTLSQNPAGIGVYRSSELGFTLDLDCQHSVAKSQGASFADNQTKFLLNNIGGVATLRLNNSVFKNLNILFTYNKGASFNRRYSGAVPRLDNSLTNYIAGVANANQLTVGDVESTDKFDPYNPNDGGYEAPWLCILGYDSYFISPTGSNEDTHWFGQWGDGTSGMGSFNVNEWGGLDEYNIALGGNINNVFYWGMNFDIVNVNYSRDTYWSESLDNAVIDDDGTFIRSSADWTLHNYYNMNGTGFNYQLGFIVKPIQELRLGFAFRTPTWYDITENFYANTGAQYASMRNGSQVSASTNNKQMASNYYSLRTPWRLTASIAGVIGGRFIISADYEWQPYHAMHVGYANNSYDYGYNDWDFDYGWGDYYPWYSPSSTGTPKAPRSSYYDPYQDLNQDFRDYYTSTNTLRLGAEFRVTSKFSVRAGYSFVSSPVKEKVRAGEVAVATGLTPSFRLDNTTNYVTCGFGYRYKAFELDMAYVWKHRTATFYAFTPDPATPSIQSPKSDLSLDNSQIVLSCGFRF